MSIDVGQSVVGAAEVEWLVFRIEKACAAGGVITAADTNVSRQGGVGLAGHAVEPCAESGVLNGATLCVAGMHEVITRFMRALGRIHRADDRDLVHASC